MTTEKETTVAKLQRQIADTEAKLQNLREKLARATTPKAEKPAATFELDPLWKAALPISRTRSSKHQCRKEWNKIPKAQRPDIEVIVNALKAWNRSPEWKKDGNAYAPGLHRFISRRQWEDLPETTEAPSRHRAAPQPVQQPSGPGITDPAEIAALLSIKTPRMNS
ncbi:hypothetical protein OVA24_06420 [Luteolibacter sp. SL250]|uniref:hypothetical protein n=1 Tax=Luteolibacter sp. SL250 TaxID=2995170 RepID=UPI0022710802|nr:hypothetical protein [Luteolibacter sp. SL250]WAC21016.1 hypothetical protein OVA24_06420 [Luteolibacter sp. SL250]